MQGAAVQTHMVEDSNKHDQEIRAMERGTGIEPPAAIQIPARISNHQQGLVHREKDPVGWRIKT